MTNIGCRILTASLLLFQQAAWIVADESPLVRAGSAGLEYGTSRNGDSIPDFSYCGYRGGGVRIPDVPVKVTVVPGDGKTDDTARLQAALDKAGSLPLGKDGHRGAVLLKAGVYRVADTLYLREAGVVLRGEGNGEQGGTVIIAAGQKKRSLISVDGGKPGREIEGTRSAVADKRVPVGARKMQLASTAGLAAGDPVVVFRPATAAWIAALGTDKLSNGADDKVKNWTPNDYGLAFERRITKIDGKSITIDVPIVCALDTEFGGGFVYKITEDKRIQEVGVENLRLVSEYTTSDSEDHAWDAVKINNLLNGWVRDVVAVHFGYSCVNIGSAGKQITVQDCAYVDPVSKVTGGRRYSFALAGQLCLVQRCYAREGRHDYVMHARVRGPNVFLDCVADNPRSDSGPHHRWATGTLYDNIACGPLNVEWRGRSGTGHGWSGANMVFWNCRASTIKCQRPPTADNYCIGCTGKIQGDGHIESPGKPVAPRSLYLRQLEERLGVEAVRSITTEAQRKGIIDELIRKRFFLAK